MLELLKEVVAADDVIFRHFYSPLLVTKVWNYEEMKQIKKLKKYERKEMCHYKGKMYAFCDVSNSSWRNTESNIQQNELLSIICAAFRLVVMLYIMGDLLR